jgi:hypothetical protein
MTFVRCPRCRDEVTVPPRATGRALVRCPLCLEEYLLAEALANAPPPLVIIGGEAEPGAIAAADGSEYRLAGGPFSATTFDSSAPAAGAALAPRPALRTSPRPRRQEKGSGVFLLVNYIVGGLLGLSLGLLVLWWGFRRDPLELGPPIARYMPLIVPSQFRGATDANFESNTQPRAPSRNRNGRQTSATQPKEPPAELQTLPGFDDPVKLPGASLTPSIDGPVLFDPGASRSPASDLLNELPKPASATVDLKPIDEKPGPPPPMPDLTDLLPDAS